MSRVKRSLPIVETARFETSGAARIPRGKARVYHEWYTKVHPEEKPGHRLPLSLPLSLSLCPLREHPPYRMRSLFEWLLVSRNILNAWPASSFSPLPFVDRQVRPPSLKFDNFDRWWRDIVREIDFVVWILALFQGLPNIISCILHTSWDVDRIKKHV